MEEIEKLRQAFPYARIVELATHGANLYFETFIVSVYWKRKKYGINGKWDRYKSLAELISVVNQRINPTPKPAPQPLNEPTASNRVQDVINHINRKIEFGKANGMSNSNVALLIALNQEITQYL